MSGDRKPVQDWHLDRRVTIGLIVTLLIHSASSVWWASGITERVKMNKAQIQKNTLATEKALENDKSMSEILARLDERSTTTNRDLGRIEEKLDKIGQK